MTTNSHPSPVADLVRLGQQLSSGGTESATYSVHGVITRVTTNSGEVARAVAKLFKPFPPAAGDAEAAPDINFHLFVVDRLTDELAPVTDSAALLYDWGMVRILCEGDNRYLRVDDRARVHADIRTKTAAGFSEAGLLTNDWLISNVFFYPLWGQLLKENGLFPLHAAGVAREGRGFLFLGKSGSGKSTLTLNLVRAGYGLLSDDTVFLRMAGDRVEALCFPEEINVSEQTMELIPELSRVQNFTVNELRQKSSFPIEELYPGCVVESTVPSVMVFPQIADAEATIVEPMSRMEALALSLRYGFLFMDQSTTGRHFEIMSQLARQADCYRLHAGRDQEELNRQLEKLLTGALDQYEEKR